jgi:hypothetical protein
MFKIIHDILRTNLITIHAHTLPNVHFAPREPEMELPKIFTTHVTLLPTYVYKTSLDTQNKVRFWQNDCCSVFVNLMPYGLLDKYQRFEAVCWLHFRDISNFPLPKN